LKQILYSHGEPAGIGVDLILHLAKLKFWEAIQIPLVVVADPTLLESRAADLSLKITFLEVKNLRKAKKIKLAQFNFILPHRARIALPES